ncbi:uncharacterized protein CANTADRAFT_23437 [Suhomyces tanzawaensis NRRL Y-17324]|uniref:Aminopeptidase n=1 Tax=Suhomyces tanzawaensis NRRL Y-17324 TaxID=984487 RepID=A0A1E4SCQ6_9ASCO|nr:uncharacterized protein CANTADRAFT_23437 [Suhomyces tanzawaensis NRRL Y-17324]ODV77307.1 hypothetical protein CANTADRAFT_23437 [Suhomyces tanzawaensis NRRL Y-17324]
MTDIANKMAATSLSSLLSLSNAYLPSSYDLKLAIDHTKPNFSGTVTLDLVKNTDTSNDSTPFEISLHANKLIITKAVLSDDNDSHSLKVTHDRANQVITLKSETPIKSPKSVTINYFGQINKIQTYKDTTRGLFKTNYLDSVSGRSDNYILATHCQPHGARLLFPLIDEVHFKVPIKLTIETSPKFHVISNALLTEDESRTSIFEFEPTPPISPSVFGFVLGDFGYVESYAGSTRVRVYNAVGDATQGAYALEVLKTSITTLEKLLNFKFPLNKIDLIGLPFLSDGAMENWGMITVICDQIKIQGKGSLEQKIQMQKLIAHEAVHQWIGNLVTFDDYSNLWLNEAFATWLGNYVVQVADFEKQPESVYDILQIESYESYLDEDCLFDENGHIIPSIHQYLSKVDTGINSSTATIFETKSYEKGIILLRMVSNILHIDGSSSENLYHEDYTLILKGLSKVLETYQFKSIKAFDIWNILNEFTSIDLPSFVHSWTRNPGFPLVKVKSSPAMDKIIFEQHTYVYDATAEQLKLEDQPYHVPLLLKVVDDNGVVKVLNVIMSDRSLKLDIPIHQFISVNNKRGGYYRTLYSSEIIQKAIVPQIKENRLCAQDIITIINDYGKVLGTSNSTSTELIDFILVINSLSLKSWKIDYHVLKVALNYLETFNNILMHFSEYTKFEEWLQQFILRLYKKVGRWESLSSLNRESSLTEVQVRNSILQFGIKNVEFQEIAKKLTKTFLNPGSKNQYIPKELLSSMFNLFVYKANQKDYKRVLELVKNSNNSLLDHSNVTQHELQTIALSSLSFATDAELVHKTLNFVMTNIDSKMIELGLIGFQYKPNKQDKIKLFQWYSLHYDQWVRKSLRKGSDWSKQMAATVKNISTMVLGEIMQYDPELLGMKEKFVRQKTTSLPPHELTELVETLEAENYEKATIGGFYPELVGALPQA